LIIAFIASKLHLLEFFLLSAIYIYVLK